MSRKRALKKQQKRQESTLAQLEELYRRGSDDEFLARAAEQVKDLPASPLAAQWAEAADRALRQSLARADLGRLERLLADLRRGGSLRPLAILAEAVLDLAAGRLEAARSRLAGLEGKAATFPEGLLAALRSLAQERPDSGWPLDDPYLQAAGELFRALQSPEIDRQALARSLEAMRAAAPRESGGLGPLLDSAGRCLSLLADLDALEERLEEGEASQASQRVSAWLRGPGPLLAAALAASGPPLLAPLQHAVRLRWRAVLEQVAEREGSTGLAALCAADPKLLGCDVSLPGGSLAGLRQAAQAHQLLAARRYRDLAQLLRSRGEAETESGALAALWSLELWASSHRTPPDEDGAFIRDADWLADLREPPSHRTLVRLQQMAGEIGRRFPAEQRAEVARALRGELFDLCEKGLCEHAAWAALSLLEHQPDDVGLLILGVAGAVAGEDTRALRSVEVLLARAGKAQAGDLAIAQRLLAMIALLDPPDVARSLQTLRPLFTEGLWLEVAAVVAREMGEFFVEELSDAVFEARESGGRPFDEVRRTLDRLRPVLAGTPEFAAMELAFDCWQPDSPAVEKRLKRYLADVPGLEGALAAFLLMDKIARLVEPRGHQAVRGRLAGAVIDRLDDRWQLWAHTVPSLAFAVRGNHLPQLEKKIRQILGSPEIQDSGRQILEKGLELVQHAACHKRPARGRKNPRPRRAGIPQLQLNL